jgi:hypothetical protein
MASFELNAKNYLSTQQVWVENVGHFSKVTLKHTPNRVYMNSSAWCTAMRWCREFLQYSLRLVHAVPGADGFAGRSNSGMHYAKSTTCSFHYWSAGVGSRMCAATHTLRPGNKISVP